MKNYILGTILLLLLNISSFAQSPDWEVKENDFQYTMSFVSFLNVSGITLSNPNDKVAAFVDGECRGAANLIYVANEDSYYAFLVVFSICFSIYYYILISIFYEIYFLNNLK